MNQAFNVAANQWSKTDVEAMNTANWILTGGFTTSVTTVDWAVGIQADANNIPLFDKVTLTYSGAFQDMVFVTNSWEASTNNPTSAFCMLDIEPVDALSMNTDLKAYVTIDDGSNYEQITLEAISV